MEEPLKLEQAKAIVLLLPTLMRKLFAVGEGLAELPLAQLRVCGSLHRGPRHMSALSRELGVSLSAMTQIADRLERARLVKRVAEGSDRRIRCLQLTERGMELMRQHEGAHVRSVVAALDRLLPEERTRILLTLQMFIDACDSGDGQTACAAVGEERPTGVTAAEMQ